MCIEIRPRLEYRPVNPGMRSGLSSRLDLSGYYGTPRSGDWSSYTLMASVNQLTNQLRNYRPPFSCLFQAFLLSPVQLHTYGFS